MADVVIRDVDGARTLLNRLARHAEGHPCVLVWDYSFDESGQRMFWVEEHMSEHTLMAYEADLRGGDFGQNLSDVPTLDHMSPVRTCLGCRGRAEQGALLRLVRRGNFVVDATRPRLPGRGGYLHADAMCWDMAGKRRALQRCFGPGVTLAPGVLPDWEH